MKMRIITYLLALSLFSGCASLEQKNNIVGKWYIHQIEDDDGEMESCEIESDKYWLFHKNGDISMYSLGSLDEEEGLVRGVAFYSSKSGRIFERIGRRKVDCGRYYFKDSFLVLEFNEKNYRSIYFSRK